MLLYFTYIAEKWEAFLHLQRHKRHSCGQKALFIKWEENTLRPIKPAQCGNRLCLDMLNKAYHYAVLGAK